MNSSKVTLARPISIRILPAVCNGSKGRNAARAELGKDFTHEIENQAGSIRFINHSRIAVCCIRAAEHRPLHRKCSSTAFLFSGVSFGHAHCTAGRHSQLPRSKKVYHRDRIGGAARCAALPIELFGSMKRAQHVGRHAATVRLAEQAQ